MAKLEIEIPRPLEEEIEHRATVLGESGDEIISRALRIYLEDARWGLGHPGQLDAPGGTGRNGADRPEAAAPLRADRGRLDGREGLPQRHDLDPCADHEIPQQLKTALGAAAAARRVPERELLLRALDRYLAGPAVVPAGITDPAEVAAARKAAAGMWKDRTDLPEVRDLRRGWERRLRRVIPDE